MSNLVRRTCWRHNPTSSSSCAILIISTLVLLVGLAHNTSAQISDGDEQYEAVHQDIGRISGLSSNAPQVAAQSALVSRQQFDSGPPATAAAATPLLAPPAPQAPRARQAPARKPNRVTLVARRDPTALPLAAATVHAPPSSNFLVPAQLPAPSSPELTTSFAPIAPAALISGGAQQQAPIVRVPAHQSSAAVAAESPALSSFRGSAGGHASSVSARHSALMAQVAAERAAAASLSGAEAGISSAAITHQPLLSPPPPPPQSSIGSPLEALSSPAIAQVQAPVSFAPQFAQPQHFQSQQQQPQATQPAAFVDRPLEPLVAPSFEHVLSNGCPHKGVFSWENKDHCDRYYMCTNGTFTEEACPNGLAYSQMGAVYQHCAYNWNVDCGRKKSAEPIASPGCPWQFGLFPIVSNGRCSIDYFACEWGVPETKRCTPEGLFYDDRIKGCQWADQLGCKSEALLNFKCPPEDEDNPYWPYPRYYHNTQDVIVCVNEQPRLVHCTDEQLVDPSSLACVDVKKKKKAKF